jgi:cytochrome b561
MSEQEKPVLEEDAKIARILGAVLMIVLPIFGFYVSASLGKEWFYDFRVRDIEVASHGIFWGAVIAAVINGYIWLRYRDNVDKDLVNEWYDPQSGHHH